MRILLNRILILVIPLLFSEMSVYAQRKGTTPVVVNSGVVYSLPRTGVRIYVKATRQQFFHGPYYQYAEAFLGLKNVPSSDYESWTIDDIKIETFSEPDPAHVYMAKGSAAALISLTSSGTISGINYKAGQDEETFQASTFLGMANPDAVPFTDLSLDPFYEQVDSLRNAVSVKSIEEKAKDAANTIMKLRQRRFETLTNEYNEQLPDGKAYEVMVGELGVLEKNYVSLFVGKSFASTHEYSFDYIPGEGSVSGDVLFRFSESKGILPKSDMSGKPIVVDMIKLDDLASAQSKLTGDASGSAGLFYRIPGKAEIKILNGISPMAVARMNIAQFGSISPLPDELLGGNYQVAFHTSTGGIMSITKN